MNAILHTIRIWGPGKLISMAKEAGLGDRLPEKFLESSICSACYSLFSSPKVVEFLVALEDDSRFRYIVADARAKYFNENQNDRAIGLNREMAAWTIEKIWALKILGAFHS